jgi:hypothetical protein
MYCKFCEKDVQKEPSCATCGKTTVDKMGWWLRYSPVLVWPFATWLFGFGAYRLIIAFKPAIGPRLMHSLVFMTLIVFAKGAWATYCRHTFEARMRTGSKPTALESEGVRVISSNAGSDKSPEIRVSDEIILDNVPQSLER